MDHLKSLEEWIKSRPKWQQEAVARIMKGNGVLTKDNIEDLRVLCLRGAGIDVGDRVVNLVDVESSEAASVGMPSPVAPRVVLRKIANVKGVAALKSRHPLIFDEKALTVIFGPNGVGKTSYVKLLKQITGSRHAEELLGDVYSDQKVPQEALIHYAVNGALKEIQWKGGLVEELKQVAVYDSKCAAIYVQNENQVAFEPFILRIFTLLSDVCTEFEKKISDEIKLSKSIKPTLPGEYLQLEDAKWYIDFSKKLTDEEIENKCAWSEERELELKSLEERAAEANPADKAKSLKREHTGLLDLIKSMMSTYQLLAADAVKTVFSAIENARLSRSAADEYSQTAFQGMSLDGIGSETWRKMWSAAQEYATTEAYKEQPFPKVDSGSVCVLCLQPIDEPTRDRFKSFETFVAGSLEKAAVEAEKTESDLLNGLVVPDESTVVAGIKAAFLDGQPEEEEIKGFYNQLRKIRDELLQRPQNLEAVGYGSDETLIENLKKRERELEDRISKFEEDAKSQDREKVEQALKSTRLQKWFGEQKDACKDELDRLRWLSKMEQAKKDCATGPISTKKSSLSQTVLTEAFVARFQNELNELGGSHIRVELQKTRAEKGKIHHQIQLKGAKTSVNSGQILSEGEFRIVSLAAFVADMIGQDVIAPFIFDDPISSLDQQYEEATVRKLIGLSGSRQVIVFTHRLSLVTTLNEVLDEQKKMPYRVALRLGGEPDEMSVLWEKPIKSLNKLLNDRLPELKRAHVDAPSIYETLARGTCCDIRIVLESLIEQDFLSGVVVRFRRSVNTLGKFENLKHNRADDIDLLDGYMTKYSVYMHSAPLEAPVPILPPAEIEADLKALQDWHKAFMGRRKTA